MRQKVVRALKPLDAISVENPAYPGTPDVNYKEGWIELKWLRYWPDAEVVRIDHFTPQQRVWLTRRWVKGGAAFLLLQVKMDWLLFDGKTAGEYVGRVGQQELRDIAMRTWMKYKPRELLSWFRSYERGRN